MPCSYEDRIIQRVVTDLRVLIEQNTPADVVPREEAENWYQLYHSIKEELKQEKMYHRETEKLCDRYCIESQHAKQEVAREIFEEIEELFFANGVFIHIQSYNELKKKYTEGE